MFLTFLTFFFFDIFVSVNCVLPILGRIAGGYLSILLIFYLILWFAFPIKFSLLHLFVAGDFIRYCT